MAKKRAKANKKTKKAPTTKQEVLMRWSKESLVNKIEHLEGQLDKLIYQRRNETTLDQMVYDICIRVIDDQIAGTVRELQIDVDRLISKISDITR